MSLGLLLPHLVINQLEPIVLGLVRPCTGAGGVRQIPRSALGVERQLDLPAYCLMRKAYPTSGVCLTRNVTLAGQQ
jgi:hypothetical protein